MITNFNLNPAAVLPQRLDAINTELTEFSKQYSSMRPNAIMAKFYETFADKIIDNLLGIYQEGNIKCCPNYRVVQGFPEIIYESSATSAKISIYLQDYDNPQVIDCSCFILAQLEALYEQILDEHQYNLRIYADYDTNIKQFMRYAPKIKDLGGKLIRRRPYIYLNLPDTRAIGVKSFAKIPCNLFNLNKLETYFRRISTSYTSEIFHSTTTLPNEEII